MSAELLNSTETIEGISNAELEAKAKDLESAIIEINNGNLPNSEIESLNRNLPSYLLRIDERIQGLEMQVKKLTSPASISQVEEKIKSLKRLKQAAQRTKEALNNREKNEGVSNENSNQDSNDSEKKKLEILRIQKEIEDNNKYQEVLVNRFNTYEQNLSEIDIKTKKLSAKVLDLNTLPNLNNLETLDLEKEINTILEEINNLIKQLIENFNNNTNFDEEIFESIRLQKEIKNLETRDRTDEEDEELQNLYQEYNSSNKETIKRIGDLKNMLVGYFSQLQENLDKISDLNLNTSISVNLKNTIQTQTEDLFGTISNIRRRVEENIRA